MTLTRTRKRRKIVMRVRPEIFKWLRESAGYSIEEVSKILGVDPKIIENIEDSNEEYEDIELGWLRKLSDKYKRQLACFFLPGVPEDEVNILTNISKRYYRYSKQEPITLETPGVKELLLAYRRARYLRSIIEEDERREPARYSMEDDPEHTARMERRIYESNNINAKVNFDGIRKYIESYSIYVFQFDLPLDIIRGFTLVDERPYIIVINSNDSTAGKLFTLMHEYAHVLLREGSYCNIEEGLKDNYNIETWCNRFAAEFLIPKDELLNDIMSRKIIDDNELNKLSNKYSVSRYALAIRLRNIGYYLDDKKLYELKQEAERYVEEKRLENYLFTWEDIPMHESELMEYSKLFDYITKRKEIKEMYEKESERLTIKRVIDEINNREIIKITLNNNCIAKIELTDSKAKLIIEGIEKVYELDVKKKDNGKRHEIYKPIRIPLLIRRKSELGSTYIDDLIEAYIDEKISLSELSEYLGLKIDKVKHLIEQNRRK